VRPVAALPSQRALDDLRSISEWLTLPSLPIGRELYSPRPLALGLEGSQVRQAEKEVPERAGTEQHACTPDCGYSLHAPDCLNVGSLGRFSSPIAGVFPPGRIKRTG